MPKRMGPKVLDSCVLMQIYRSLSFRGSLDVMHAFFLVSLVLGDASNQCVDSLVRLHSKLHTRATFCDGIS
jgi:hypothetical protein